MSKSICNILKKNDVMYRSYIYTKTNDNIYIGCIRYGINGCRKFFYTNESKKEILYSCLRNTTHGPLDINEKYWSKWTTFKNSISHINNIRNRFTEINTHIYNNTLIIYIDHNNFFNIFPQKYYTDQNLFTNFNFKIDKIKSFSLKTIIDNSNLFTQNFIIYIYKDFIPYLESKNNYIEKKINNNLNNDIYNSYKYKNKKSGKYSFLYPKLEFIEN